MKNFFFNKLIVGSANLEQKYGLNKNKIKINEYKKILNFLTRRSKVFLDTSSEYKNAEKIIGSLNLKKLNIITKIKVEKKNDKNLIESEIFDKINNSKKIFKKNKLYAVLIHNPACLLSKDGKIIYDYLRKLKNKKYFKKIGVSIYDMNQIKFLNKKYDLEIIQLPYNVFDQRLDKKEIYEILKKKNLEIHARSIFLQGTLLKHSFYNFKNALLQKKLIDWNKWLDNKKLKSLDVCVSNSLLNNKIDKIVVGFDSFDQFKQYLRVNIKKNDISFFSTNNKKIINPTLWN
jgi:aryl-alcohol dehydrogenase-like predicted oxidoreductase